MLALIGNLNISGMIRIICLDYAVKVVKGKWADCLNPPISTLTNLKIPEGYHENLL